MMYEHCRGTDSFWEPFLAMLPMPGSVSEWTDDEMGELQDEVLATESAWRPRFQKQHYDRLMDPLCERFPDIFGETRKEEEEHAPILIDVCAGDLGVVSTMACVLVDLVLLHALCCMCVLGCGSMFGVC